MTGRYFLPAKKARTCRRAGILFLVAAAWFGLGMAVAAVAPGLRVSCDVPKPCETKLDPVVLLTEDERTFVAQHPAARAGVDAWGARPDVRVGLGVLNLLDDGSVVAVLLAIGLALRRLGARGDDILARAVPWLKHASRAGVVWAVLRIFTHGMRSLLLAPGTSNPQFPINLDEVPLPLLLAVAAYVIASALEAGIGAERELSEIV